MFPWQGGGVTRTRFALLCTAVVAVAFGIGLAWGLHAGGSSTSPSGAAPSASATSSSDSGPGLPPALVTGCQTQDVPTGRGWTCSTPRAGVDEVLVVRWPSPDALASDFAATYGRKPDGKCSTYQGRPPSGYRSTWGNGKPLACYLNRQGAAVVLWEVPDQALQLLAIRKDGDARAAFRWWTDAVTIPVA